MYSRGIFKVSDTVAILGRWGVVLEIVEALQYFGFSITLVFHGHMKSNDTGSMRKQYLWELEK